MTPAQVRAARGLLDWSVDRLSSRSGTSYHMVRTFERTGKVAPINVRAEQEDAVVAIRATLEAAGVEFTDGAVPGVRLRKSDQ